MGQNHSASANKSLAPKAKLSTSISLTPSLPRLLRISTESSRSSSNASQYEPTPTLGAGKQSNLTQPTGRSKTNKHSRTSEKLISSLDKRVQSIVRNRHSASGNYIDCSGSIKQQQYQHQQQHQHQQLFKVALAASDLKENAHLTTAKTKSSRRPKEQLGHRRETPPNITDSEVFIYPPNYRDMSECHKCARDNKICDCIVIEAQSPTVDHVDAHFSKCASQTLSNESKSAQLLKSTSSPIGISDNNPSDEANHGSKGAEIGTKTSESGCHHDDVNNNHHPVELLSKCENHQGPETADRCSSTVSKPAAVSDISVKRPTANLGPSDGPLGCDLLEPAEQIKRVYKISIATASIDQKSNTLRLSSPKILSSQASSGSSCRNSQTGDGEPRLQATLTASESKSDFEDAEAWFLRLHQNDGLDHYEKPLQGSRKPSNNFEAFSPTPSLQTSGHTHDEVSKIHHTNTLSTHYADGHPDEQDPPGPELSTSPLSFGSVSLRSRALTISTPARFSTCLSWTEQTSSIVPSAETTTFTPASSSNEAYKSRAQQDTDQGPGGFDLQDSGEATKPIYKSRSFESISKHRLRAQQVSRRYKKPFKEQQVRKFTPKSGHKYSSAREGSSEQLTCNLALGDAIKITSTSRLFSGNVPNDAIRVASSNKSKPIKVSASMRRKKLASNRTNQVVFDELYDGGKQYSVDEKNTQQISNPIESTVGQPGDGFDSPTLGYSPILSSVRAYIENINPELRLPTITATSARQICLDNSSAIDLIVEQQGVEQEQPASTVRLIDSHNDDGTPIELQSNDIIVQTSAAATVVTSRALAVPLSCANGLEGPKASRDLDTPKKSIFEGASKDEILEYLEDARERVPDILIAADEVMVISESELIVVNQLEPGSPATPISIVEETEMIQSNSSPGQENVLLGHLASGDPLSIACERNLYADVRASDARLGEPIKLGDTDSPPSYARDPLDGNFFGQPLSSEGIVEDELTGSMNVRLVSATMDQQSIESKSPDNGTDIDELPNSGKLSIQETSSSQSNASYGNASRDDSSPMSGSLINYSTPPPTANQGSRQHHHEFYKNMHEAFTRQRRKSTSESCDRAADRKNALQTIFMQQRYPNRKSLSSSSSSPPSSASPSTYTSQTSGNCSAASNFYTSISLSCSSPLLALSQVTSSNPQTAFNSGTGLVNGCNGNYITARQTNVTNSANILATERAARLESSDLNSLTISNLASLDNACATGASVHLHPHDDDSFEHPSHDDSTAIWSTTNVQQQQQQHLQQQQDQVMPTGQQQSSVSQSASCEANNNVGKSSGGLSRSDSDRSNRLSVIEENHQHEPGDIKSLQVEQGKSNTSSAQQAKFASPPANVTSVGGSNTIAKAPALASRFNQSTVTPPSLTSASSLMTRPLYSHYATINRLNNYLMNRVNGSMVEFQCRDCDQLIVVDHTKILDKTNEIKSLRDADISLESMKDKPMSFDQLERAYIVAMNGLPLCKSCEKKRNERKEIILEFVETELKYGRDLKIIHDEFYRPMQIAGLLNKDQISGIFLNLDELIMAHCRFADRLGAAINEANLVKDTDYNTVNIGKLFVESADMLHTFESYCIRQGSAACLLARLAKEKELLRIFLRVSQMENTLLRRMNLAAFLMVPVQRVTKYPLLLNRLYKVTPYHHKDREALRDAQSKVEHHLEHINQQTSGISATNKIWRRISNLSAPNSSASSNRRGMINAEDIGYIKLRKAAMDLLKWDRDEIQFIHSGKLDFAPLNEYLTRQKMKPIRYMSAHALLIVLGKPNWKYRPDLIKPNLDNKLMVPTVGGNGIKEAALLLLREKNGRFIPCRDPLLLSNCVLSTDCSQFNCENSPSQHSQLQNAVKSSATSAISQSMNGASHGSDRRSLPGLISTIQRSQPTGAGASATSQANCMSPFEFRASSAGSRQQMGAEHFKLGSFNSDAPTKSLSLKGSDVADSESIASAQQVDSISMSSMKSLPEDQISCHATAGGSMSGVASCSVSSLSASVQAPRSYSLASALPRTPIATDSSNSSLTKTTSSSSATNSGSSNSTILNQIITRVNNYHNSSKQHPQALAEPGSVSKCSAAGGPPMAKTMSFSQTTTSDCGNSAQTVDGTCTQSQGDLSRDMDATNRSTDSMSTTSTTTNKFPGHQVGNEATNSKSSHNKSNNPTSTTNTTGASPTGATNSDAPASKKLATMGNSMGGCMNVSSNVNAADATHFQYNLHFFHNHHQPYGAYEESFEIHERIGKESLLLRADTPLKTRYWLQMLRYHAKDLGQWRMRRSGLANIMMMRQE